jgi:DNA (cytosine-5)-methyltransferase 1
LERREKARAEGKGFGLAFQKWDKPCGTIDGHAFNGSTANVYPLETLASAGIGAGELLRRLKGDGPMNYDVTPQQPDNGYTVAEVFAGGGLMAVGLKTAGFKLVWANDFEKTAVAAYKHNLGDHITLGDITQIDPADIPDTDIIAGGPPCQDYSVAGAGAGEDGERGKLVWTYLNLIEVKQPKAFIFENVKGLIQKKHRHTFDALLVAFDEIGYTVSWKLISSWDYGVAQKRERVFIVGIRKDLGFSYEFPQPEPGDVRTQVLRDVIGDLPEPFNNHEPKPLGPITAERLANGGYETWFKKHPPGEMDKPYNTLTAHIAKGGPDGVFYPDNHNAEKFPQYVQNILDGKSKTNFGVMPIADMNDPARTMLATYGNKKPTEILPAPRRFTVRECLRIQSVPDWYVIPDMSLGAQYRIVGNGVASRVAWYLGKALADQLDLAEMLA